MLTSTALAFAALLLGVSTVCKRDSIDIKALETDLVGLWWDEYEYSDVTATGGDYGTVTIGGKVVGTVSESPFVYKP